MSLYLVIRQSGDRALEGRRYEVEAMTSPITVGRDPGCSIEIRSPKVAPRHARFELREVGWCVIDEGSGAVVAMEQGAAVRIGDTVIELVELIVETHFQLGTTDGLTRLFNKRAVLERIDADMRARCLAVIRIDVDGLRTINLERGYEAGDQVLVALARLLREQLRGDDYAGRLSADNFLVVMPGADREAATLRADELRGQSLTPISVGIAVQTPSDRDAAELVYRADADRLRAACR